MTTSLRTLFLLVFTFLCAGLAHAEHQGSINGVVRSGATQSELIGAYVFLEDTGKSTTTDELGIFHFDGLAAGTYQIRISYLGFADAILDEIQVTDNKTTALRIFLEPSILSLPTVNIMPDPDQQSSTISAFDINLRPLNTAQDILPTVPGLVIAQHAGGGKAEQIFYHGFDIDHGTDLRIEVDGIPVNMVSHAHGQGYADLHFVIPETVSDINYFSGPYDASQGNFATAGSVSFRTINSPADNMVKIEAGAYDTYRLVGMTNLLEGAKSQNQQAYLAAEYAFSDSYFDSPQGYTRTNLFGKYTGRISEDHQLQVLLSRFDSRWDASGQIPQRAVDQGLIGRFGSIDDTEGGQTNRTNLSITSTQIVKSQSVFKNQLYYTNYGFELFSNFTFFAEDPENGDQIRQREQRQLWGYHGQYSNYTDLGNFTLRSRYGVQLRYDQTTDSELSRTLNRRVTLEQLAFGQVDEINASIYTDQELQLSEDLVATVGVRYDQFRFNYADELNDNYERRIRSEGRLSPKAKLAYRLTPSLQLYAKSGLGFHSNDSRLIRTDPNLESLPRAYAGELGFTVKIGKSFWLDAAAWRIDLDQELVYVGDAAVVEPSDATRRYGVDASLRGQLAPWLFADANLSYTKPRYKDVPEGENFVPLAPDWISNGGLTVRTERFNGSLRYRFVDDRPANETGSVTAQGYLLLDAVVRYRLKNIEFGLTAENLLNEEWNEAQFDTESRLRNEAEPVSELHFTPGRPFFVKGSVSFYF